MRVRASGVSFPESRRRLAAACFLQGLTASKPVRKHGTSGEGVRGLVSCQKVSAQDAVCLSSDGRKSERAASLSSEAAGLLRDFFKHSSKALVFKNSLRLLGNEHIPVPGPFEPFPIFSLDFVNCGKSGDSDITLRFRLALCWTEDFSRYRVLCKVQLAEPGLGRNPGKMRNFLSPSVPSAAVSEIAVTIKDYKSVWGLSLDTYSCICATSFWTPSPATGRSIICCQH